VIVGWTECVACTGQMRNAYKICVGKPEGRDNMEDLGVRWEIAVRMYLRDIQ
jgi:hypothetical protein